MNHFEYETSQDLQKKVVLDVLNNSAAYYFDDLDYVYAHFYILRILFKDFFIVPIITIVIVEISLQKYD